MSSNPSLNFELSYRIINRSNRPLIVKGKGGLGYIIRKSKEVQHSELERLVVVELKHIFLNDLIIEEKRAMTLFDQALLQELSKAQKSNTRQGPFVDIITTDLVVAVRLTPDLIEKNDAIHSELLGITLYGDAEGIDKPCLNTPEYVMQELYDLRVGEYSPPVGGLHHFIYVNDPEYVLEPLYANVMGRSIMVGKVIDRNRPSGLYIWLISGNDVPTELYYTFDDLNDKVIEGLGLFKTKAAAEQGGNTERATIAENRQKELTKEVVKFKELATEKQSLLEKAEEKLKLMDQEMQRTKFSHSTAMDQLKNRYETDLGQIKFQAKLSGDMSDYKAHLKDVTAKNAMEQVKQRNSATNWGEVAKAVAAISGVALTGYKLFTG